MPKSWQDTVTDDIHAGKRVGDQYIVDMIRDAVLSQRLPPGTRLPEATLGGIFGVSRSVVRKALTRLVGDHVVVQQPNQVARVASPDIQETKEIFAARRLVEGEVAALLAGKLSSAQYEELRQIVEEEHGAHQQGDEARRVKCSLAVHRYLADHSPNRVLGSMLTDLILRTSIVIALYKRPGMEACYLDHDHADLLNLLGSGSPQQACNRMRQHLSDLEGLLDLRPQGGRIDLAAILGGIA
ncbi:GntR family transcriptional regulator [Halomonas sp. McH1-25]|uniref:GntR family transcriptional regulator n=1 Tax=unclassified Halomonas TaxID=2609666 RepID=UPI001EF5F335|nr:MULTISPECIES: GntR family transcriptional regulator [unclassified Halomonas]MCG7598577.1 GntR family transcriptional regulator [Halomonas sp. McH1-25]MCP1342273.1 GntR family transcriptional regulator [Halomonas sp. FL8]MCP1363124.1 GntR family transcriptional regulator [Halomonas sp. BBD45]